MRNLTESDKLKFQRISPEEREKKGILGRLYGPCADVINATRNGRKYGEELWSKVFSSPIVKEQYEAGGIFGELNHPDYEEVAIEKIAIVMPEPPAKGTDGLLYGYWDILDTPCGRILKTLCDYGYKVGISTRGSGEVTSDFLGNEEVDPDTYNLSALDIVSIPAVKAARLQYVTESLNKTRYNVTLREKLTESINKETVENQKIVKESLTTLGINLDEAQENKATPYSVMCKTYKNNRVFKDREKQSAEIQDSIDWLENNNKKHDLYQHKSDNGCTLFYEDLRLMNTTIESPVADWRDLKVGDKIKLVSSLFGFKSEELQEVTGVTSDYVEVFPVEPEEKRTGQRFNDSNWENVKVIENINSAVDNNKAVLDELQEQLATNKKLEQMVINLQEQLSVSYAKENSLSEKLSKAEKSVTRLAETTKSNKALVGKVAKLNSLVEQLNTEKTASYKQLNESVSNKDALQKELSSKDTRIAKLSEQLKEKTDEHTKLTNSIEDMENKQSALKESYANKLKKSNALVEKYQRIAKNAVNHYIESKAVSLGVKAQEIKNRLPESYSFNDIDTVCESLKKYSINLNNLPFSTQLNESVSVSAKNIDNDMLVPRNVEDDITEIDMKLAEMFR